LPLNQEICFKEQDTQCILEQLNNHKIILQKSSTKLCSQRYEGYTLNDMGFISRNKNPDFHLLE
jgi:hypothetical protein